MKRVWVHLQLRRSEVASHPFFVWLNSDTVARERRFVFAPVMVDFIMGFADMNKWFLSYPEPRNELERAINEHTLEDRTHSRLFQDNWYTLELAGAESWAPTKMLWWLFHARGTDAVRRFGMEILGLAVRFPDPLVRFAMMEAIEICGDVFFGHTAPIAEELSATRGVQHVYFGQYHRERETGHLHTDETVFTRSVLTAEQQRDALMAIDRIYDNFLCILDEILHYGTWAANDPFALMKEIDDEYVRAVSSASSGRAADSAGPPMAVVSAPHPTQLPVLFTLERQIRRIRRHPLLAFLREDPMEPVSKLLGFVPLWGIDIAGYKDFNQLVLRYPEPRDEREREINRWARELASHGALYLRDLAELGVDDVLRWDSGETIAFYFLSEPTEIHRRNMAAVKKYAFTNDDPVLRYWLIKALESAGAPLFEATAKVAREAERTRGITLDYWAGRHAGAEGADVGEPVNETLFLSAALSPDDGLLAMRMIHDIFDNIEEQFTVSYQAAKSNTFVRAPASLPPPRVSLVVPRERDSVSTSRGEDGMLKVRG